MSPLYVVRASIKSWRQAKARVARAEPYGDTVWLEILDDALASAEFTLANCILAANGRVANVVGICSLGKDWEPASLCVDGTVYTVSPERGGLAKLTVRPAFAA